MFSIRPPRRFVARNTLNGCRVVMTLHRVNGGMSIVITIEEAQANLIEIVYQLEPGEEIIIMEKGRPVATLIGIKETNKLKQSPATPRV